MRVLSSGMRNIIGLKNIPKIENTISFIIECVCACVSYRVRICLHLLFEILVTAHIINIYTYEFYE